MFFTELNLEDLNFGNNDLEGFLEEYDSKIKNTLDKHLPLENKIKRYKDNQLWYTEQIRCQKRIIRNRERIWRKYRAQHQWEAFKEERNKYFKEVRNAKKDFFSSEFIKYKNDSKHLYKLLAKLTGGVAENPMPESENDETLSNDFADFFLDKILKIRKNLDKYDKYQCE